MKVLFLLPLIALSLTAATIELNTAPTKPKRVVPSSMDEVLSFSPSVESVVRSVVNISTTQRSHNDQRLEKMMNDPYYKYFFGQPRAGTVPKERAQRALGSGVILSKDGYIITNSHVIDEADEITVTLPHNKQEFKAKLIGQDKESDLAVIKIEATDLLPIMIGSSSDLKVGDVVFAVGNPFGVGETVTQGIISALNKNRVGINQFENFIQTDASINPGNSGGALVDSRGVLIGINSAILSRSGGSAGIGFAIPANMVANVAKHLVSDGKVTRGYIGLIISDLNKQLLPLYEKKLGAIVVNIEEGGPAASYGLKRGDLVYQIDDKEVSNASDMKQIIASLKPEQRITAYVERDKKEKEIKVVLSTRNKDIKIATNAKMHKGLKLGVLNRSNRERYRIASTVTGVLIEDVHPNSSAEKVGFQSGDVIIQIENKNIDTMTDITTALESYHDRSKRVYVNRYGMILMFVID